MRGRLSLWALAAFMLAACGGPDDDPMTPASESTARAEDGRTAREATLRKAALEAWIRDAFQSERPLGYRASEFDLDGDGRPELLVYVGGPGLCGSGGCRLVVLKRDGRNFTEVVRTTRTKLPLGVLDSESNGWADLWVSTSGGELSGRRILKFDGASYPSDPTAPPAEKLDILDAQVLIENGDLIRLDGRSGAGGR